MRFIHIADIHLGAKPESGSAFGEGRDEELWSSFRNIIDNCNKDSIDLLLIAGDLFHRTPLVRELKEVAYLFESLAVTRVVFIAGNHDYIGSRSNYTGFPFPNNTILLSSAQMDSIYFEDINTEIYGFSYHTRDILEPLYQRVVPGVEERINLLLAHGGDAKDIPIDFKQLSLAGFDYIALGHIHKPQRLTERMAYAGSLEPLDKNELGEHGYIAGDIKKEEGQSSVVSLNFVTSAMRQYRKLDLQIGAETTNGAFNRQIIEKASKFSKKDYIRINVEGFRDPEIIFDIKEAEQLLKSIIEFIDHTVPDYDFEKLVAENQGNLIGLFIERILAEEVEEEVKRKALCYGLEALLKEKC